MKLFAQVQRVCKPATGPAFETQFLLEGCDPTDPQWTRDARLAAVLPWEDADRLAPSIKAHAVMISSQRHQEQQEEATKIAGYQRELARRKLD